MAGVVLLWVEISRHLGLFFLPFFFSPPVFSCVIFRIPLSRELFFLFSFWDFFVSISERRLLLLTVMVYFDPPFSVVSWFFFSVESPFATHGIEV